MRLAAVDIGTNTTRMLVAVRTGPPSAGLRSLERMSTVTRLGRGVDGSRRLDPAAIERTLAALDRYAGLAAASGASLAGAVATSAVRDAGDRDDFLDAAATVLGLRPRVISGEEEAALTFLGVRGSLEDDGVLLVIDPGGGSTEFVFGAGSPTYSASVDIGSVRITERFLHEHPPAGDMVTQATAEIRALFGDIRLPDEPDAVVGVGGTFTSLAAILLDLETYDQVAVHGSRFHAASFAELAGRLSALSIAETAAIPSLDPDRAPVLLGGALVASAALEASGAELVVVSEADILDGVVLSADLEGARGTGA